MRKTIFTIIFLYSVFTAFYLWAKYSLVDNGQCGRCVNVCSAVCLENNPCGMGEYMMTYFKAAFDGCRNLIK